MGSALHIFALLTGLSCAAPTQDVALTREERLVIDYVEPNDRAFLPMRDLLMKNAGPIFLPALREAGVGLLLGGMLVTMSPLVVGLAFGHFALRMNPILLLGALTGSQTVTSAMAAIQDRSGSPVAVLGDTPA